MVEQNYIKISQYFLEILLKKLITTSFFFFKFPAFNYNTKIYIFLTYHALIINIY